MLPRTKSLVSKTHTFKPLQTKSIRHCITGVNSPYFQIENAPWSTEPIFRDGAKIEPFPVFRCIDFEGNVIDATFTLPFSEEKLISMYKNMCIVQAFDETFYRLARAGYISFYMQNNGEEGLAVASCAAWDMEDIIFLQYREMGAFVERGMALQQCADVCFSNRDDYNKGRQMPVHYGSKELNMVTISSTLATQMPQASGAAYGMKRSGKKACVVCYFGEGAASEGDAHAALNFSATTEAPIIWLCRNNGYAISTPTKDQYRGDGIAARASGYGMYAHRFDGNDLFATYLSCKAARELCINEQRPILLEAMTYRASHHSTSDDSKTYRRDTEEEQWKTKFNPIRRVRLFMEKELIWTDKKERDLQNDVAKQIEDVARIGQSKLKPNWRHCINETFDKNTPHLQEQMDDLEEHLKIYSDEEYYNLHQYDDKE